MARNDAPPYERSGVHRRIRIRGAKGDTKVYVLLEEIDGQLSGIALKADKEGSTIGGLLKALGETATLALKYGAPLSELLATWSRMMFEPAGATDDPALRQVSSIPDAVARYLARRYLPPDPAPDAAQAHPEPEKVG